MTPEAAVPSLPRTMILSYVTNVSTPTRVRIVAARASVVAGLACIALLLLLAALVIYLAYQIAESWTGLGGGVFFAPVPSVTFRMMREAIPLAVKEHFYLLPLFPFLATGAPLLLLIAPATRRGRQPACILGICFYGLTMPLIFLGAVIAGCYACLMAGLAGGPYPDRSALWWLLLVPAAAILCLVLRDVCTLLLWIIRNPAAEKPSVSFIGNRADAGTARDPAAPPVQPLTGVADPQIPARAMPQAHVLAYVTAITTPTRVRRLAAWGVMITGILGALWGITGAGTLALRIYNELIRFGGAGLTLNQMYDIISFELGFTTQPLAYIQLIVAATGLLNVGLLIFGRAIRAGRRIPCLLARWLMWVPMAQLGLHTALFCGYALVMMLPNFGATEPSYGLRFLLLPPAFLALLVMQDIRSFLLWVARNPVGEKPPTPFLPGRPSESAQ